MREHIHRKSSLWSPQPVEAADVVFASAVSKLKNTKSTEHDQMNLQRIKESLIFTIPYNTLIINASIVTKVFPKQWKHSIIIPIHKSGDTEEPTNFRPINLLPILFKILEKVISTQLTEYLENNNLLNESQYAYRHNSSSEQALVNVVEQIYKSIDKVKISLLVLLDLSKAFDSVNNDLLQNKVVQLKIDTTWFASYLHDRTHSE